MDRDEVLLKKWELLWNHYKHQNECVDKRRNFLWIIQALIFTGWYHAYKAGDRDIFIALTLSFSGFLISIIWFFVLSRERHSILITEMTIRDVEVEWNNLYNDKEFHLFILQKLLLREKGTYNFKYINDKIGKLKFYEFYKKLSSGLILNQFIPLIIALLWLVIIIYYHYY